MLKFDYNFHLIERQEEEPVKIRIDFTNLEGYWDEITNGTVSSNSKKRDLDHHVSFSEWKSRIDDAKKRTNDLKKRHTTTGVAELAVRDKDREKRWFGKFLEWLEKITTLESKEVGVLPMAFGRFFNLFSGRIFCRSDTGVTFTAGLDITTDLQLNMDTRYSYYFSGTVVPPRINDMYAFARTQPKVMAGITLAGDAQLAYATEPKRLINTLTYPGLAIKGIAAVGPSLDIWGQLSGAVTVSGHMRVGVTYTFKPIEMYLPNTDETHNRAEEDLEENQVDQEGLEPTFEANVQARVDFNVTVSPEFNMGIQVGGRIGPFDGLLVDAHVSAFANTTLNFNARASASTVNRNYNWEYDYEIAFWYRIGLAAIAQIRLYGEWRSRTYYPVDWQKIKLFGPDEPIRSDVLSPQNVTKRDMDARSNWLTSTSPLPHAVFDAPAPLESLPKTGMVDHIRVFDSHTDSLITHGNVSIRQEDGEHQDDSKSDLEFRIGNNKFTCNSAPAICGGSGIDQTGGLNRRGITALGPRLGPLSGRSLEPRVKDDDCAVLPKLYYNCKTAFADWSFTVPASQGGTDQTLEMDGICKTLEKHMYGFNHVTGHRGTFDASRALCRGTSCTLTYDGNNSNRNRRRSQSCEDRATGLSPCAPFNDDYEQYLWGPGSTGNRPNGGFVSCDEFPFASSEEGGNAYDDPAGTITNSLFGVKTICAPTWQQNLQANCNGKLPITATIIGSVFFHVSCPHSKQRS